jgi:uncharacterized NAD(P)/FAD-binding protein YdhS
MTRTIVIIGGGCSGTLAALNLLKPVSGAQHDVVLIEPRSEVGRGLAYTVPSDRCKLNVPANGMGAYPDDPEGFLTWTRSEDPSVEPDQFVSRRLYGSYLQSLLRRAQESASPGRFRIIRDAAVDVRFDEDSQRFQIELARQPVVQADACVLALGNLRRSTLNGIEVSSVFSDPYDEESYEAIAQKQRMIIVGTGLTAVDCVLEAEGRGYKGEYVMLSRHARLPLPHEPVSSLQTAQVDAFFGSLNALVSVPLSSLVRKIREEAERLGSSQPVIAEMRPHLQQLWAAMPLASKRRFLRHIRPFWEVHRHRIPEAHAVVLDALRKSGRLIVTAGRLQSAHRDGGKIELEYLLGRETVRKSFDIAMCCAGPESDIRKVELPLIGNLLRRGIIRPGPLGLGIDPIESSLPGDVQQRFRILGPLQREHLWEITAVREIRSEAVRLAKEVHQHLSLNP